MSLVQRICLSAVLGIFLGGGGISNAEASQKVQILLYHHLQDLPPTASPLLRAWTLSPKKLDSQVEWLTEHGFHTVTMAQLVAHLKHRQPLPPKPIVLTFDDGWRDHYNVAFPILKKYNSVATFFIITGEVGHSAYMNWEQIQAMAAAGMDMEAHSLTHPKLTLISTQEAFHEILQSKQDLESRMHRSVTVFAYPFGAFNDTIMDMVKRAGFDGAAAVHGMNTGYMDGLYTLYRKVVMNYEGLDNFAGQNQ
jgi:peptidoglycan/xylan/chitin deacetylase (PgdA/CDA1 family)